jgi:hypothetical protein
MGVQRVVHSGQFGAEPESKALRCSGVHGMLSAQIAQRTR